MNYNRRGLVPPTIFLTEESALVEGYWRTNHTAGGEKNEGTKSSPFD